MKENKQLFIGIGDTHGDHKGIMMKIAKYKITDSVFIHVGDFGIGFIEEHKDLHNLNVLNEHFVEANNMLYVIRGNHDNPKFFDGYYQLSNVKLMPDYSVIELNGNKILLVGGAISIDRKQRLSRMQTDASYGRKTELFWHDERFILKKEISDKLRDIKYVVSHTSPKFAYPNNLMYGYSEIVHEFAAKDSSLYNDLDNERDEITKLYDSLVANNKIENWIYGHFHSSKLEEHFCTKFTLLSIDEFKEIY